MPKKPAKTPVHRPPPPQHVRIIGGAWKRTQLPVLDALGLRPTPDRVRETVFNWISHQWGNDWSQATVLDLFAGSGALGFEAASRGARSVVMVDTHTPVVRQLEAVKTRLHADTVTLLRADALATAQSMALRGQRFDLVFLDPPYQQDLLERTLPLCAGLLNEDALVYVESGAALPFAADNGNDDDDNGNDDDDKGNDDNDTAAPTPDWLAPWEAIRADKAGIVFYHLLKLRAANPA